MSKKAKWIIGSLIGVVVLMILLKVAGVFGKDEGIKVTAEKAAKRDITEIVNAPGKVYPEIEVKVSPDISGEITELNVEEGDSVKKGQVLARIYADIYDIQKNQAASGVSQSEAQAANSRAAIDALKAQMEQAQKTYNMQKQLYDDKVISKNEFNLADANYKTAQANYNAATHNIQSGNASIKSAQANLAKANKDLSKTVIVAPMDGVVSLLNVKKGEKVAGNSFNVGTEMMRIADMQKIEIRVDVGESDITKVHLGDSASVEVEAYNDRKFKGVVTQIASSNNGATAISATSNTSSDVTNYKVSVRLLPESYMDLMQKGSFPFKPGMSATAYIATKTNKNVISVPVSAVTTRVKSDKEKTLKNDENTSSTTTDDDIDVVVFLVEKDGLVKKVKVKTAIQDITYIEITEGLKVGDLVVTAPNDKISKDLKEKDKVKIVDKKEDLFEKK